MPKLRLSLTVLFLVVLSFAVSADGPPPAIQATWRTGTFAADGDDGDWAGEPASIAGGPVAIAVMNDAEYLYLRVRAADRGGQLQLLFGGLTVWFDPKGGDKRVFGIRYPVGSTLPAPKARGQRPEGRGGSPPQGGAPGGGQPPAHPPRDRGERGERGGSGGPAVPSDLNDIVPRRLEVLGPGKDDVRSLVLDHAAGISVGLGRVGDVVVYELRVPLKKTAEWPYAIGVETGAVVGIGFDSPKMQQAKPPDDGKGGSGGSGGGPGGIGIGGFGMGVPGGMGRGGPGGPGGPNPLPESAKPWKAWTKIALARSAG